MKKIILITAAVLTLTTSAYADGWNRHYHNHNHYYNGGGRYNGGGDAGGALIGGLLGGMILGGMLAQPHYQQQPQYYQPEPQCWRQRFYDAYGRMFVREVCNYGDN